MNAKGADYPYKGLSFNTVAQRPAVVGNFESSIPQAYQPTSAKKIRFSVSASYIPQLALAGFTHLSLANNHTFDFARAGYDNAKNILEQNQLSSFGHPNQLDGDAVEFIEIQDTVIAVIAAHTLQQLPTYSELKAVFEYASARSDFQLVYVHWGTEYVSVHNSRQREAAERFVEAGADVVIGHHPHVVQDIELIDGVPVFYSLGNYIFDQYDAVDTQEGLVLHLELSKAQPRISLLPVTSVGTLSQPRFMEAARHATFLESLADRSDPELREFIRSGQMLLDVQVASSSKVAMISQ
jgi:poly-gamma-glutamate synthesis protein (capsule biosynthesis protein)